MRDDDLFEDDDDSLDEEWIDDADDLDGTAPCPNCGRDIHELADVCPFCGDFLVDRRETVSGAPSWTTGKPGWFVVLGVLGVIAALVALMRFTN